MMYAYITCQPDIWYTVTTMSKFSSAPTAYHYKLLKEVGKCLHSTIGWSIKFKQTKHLENPVFEASHGTIFLMIHFLLLMSR